MHRQLATRPALPTKRKRFLAAGAALGMITLGVFCGVDPASASAADDFNPHLVSTWEQQYGDCTIWSGPVVDPQQDRHGFAVLAGGEMECGSDHHFTIIATEMFSSTGASDSYYPLDGAGSAVVTGRGSGLVESTRWCGTGWWFTRVTVVDYSAYNYRQDFDSAPAEVAALGNGNDGC